MVEEQPPYDPYATQPLPQPPPQLPSYPPPVYPPPGHEQPYATAAYPLPGYPPPPAPQHTDAVSIIALVTSVVGAVLASIPLAIIGLARTKDGRRSGRWAAVTAIVLSLVWVLAIVVGVAGYLASSSSSSSTALAGTSALPSSAASTPSPSDTPTPTETPTSTPTPTPTPTVKPAKVVTHSVYIGNVTKGHCFNEPKKGSSFVPELTTCRAPHDEEMMGTVQLGSGSYPGSSGARTKSDKACAKLFATYIGVPSDQSELGVETWWPSSGLWGSGHHIAQCAVYTPDQKTVGTLKGSQR